MLERWLRWWHSRRRHWEIILREDGCHADVVPLQDSAMHDLDNDCVCGPMVRHQVLQDGSDGWLVVHQALDGRA